MSELWQLYNEDGTPITGKGAIKDEVFKDGLLHGAAHVWIWRPTGDSIEVLLQRRAANKRTWPNLLDISAAGHIDLGETPLEAAVRETKEEIGVDVDATELEPIDILKGYMVAPDGSKENEFRWLYGYQLKSGQDLNMEEQEVSALLWKSLDVFTAEVLENRTTERYVPQPEPYFDRLIPYLGNLTTRTT